MATCSWTCSYPERLATCRGLVCWSEDEKAVLLAAAAAVAVSSFAATAAAVASQPHFEETWSPHVVETSPQSNTERNVSKLIPSDAEPIDCEGSPCSSSHYAPLQDSPACTTESSEARLRQLHSNSIHLEDSLKTTLSLSEVSVGKNTEARPRWADLDDSDAEDLPMACAANLEQKPLENRPAQSMEARLRWADVYCNDLEDPPTTGSEFLVQHNLQDASTVCSTSSEQMTFAMEMKLAPAQVVERDARWVDCERLGHDDGKEETAGQRQSKPTRGKRGGVGRNPGRHTVQSQGNWDAATSRAGQSQRASNSLWHKGGSRQWKDDVGAAGWGQQTQFWEPRLCDRKQQCQFIIGIVEEPKFRVVRRLLGSGGTHVKAIAEESGAKLRLRGVGSKFFEGPEKRESSDPLMLCVSALTLEGYNIAVRSISEHLERIYLEFHESQLRNNEQVLRLKVQMHEGARLVF